MTPCGARFTVLLLLLLPWNYCNVSGRNLVTSSSRRRGSVNLEVLKSEKVVPNSHIVFGSSLRRNLRSVNDYAKKHKSDYNKFDDYEGMQVDQPLAAPIKNSVDNGSDTDTTEIPKKLASSYAHEKINKKMNKSDDLLFLPQQDSEGSLPPPEVWKSAGRLGHMGQSELGKVDCIPTSQDTLALMLGAAFNSRYMSIGKPSLRENHPLSVDHKMDGAVLHDEAERTKKSFQPSESFSVNELFSRVLDDEPVYSSRGRRQRNVRSLRHHSHAKSTHHHQNKDRSTTPFKQHRYSIASKEEEASTITPDTWVDHLPPPIYTGDMTVEKFLQYIRRSRSVSSGPPWHCQSRVQWIDLGRQYFPRYLRTTECTSEKCWFGHFRCQARAFTIKLLRRRQDSCEMNAKRDAVDHRIPVSMQEEWVFEERAVTFCCECTM